MADFKDEQEYHTSRLRSYLNIPEQSELEALSDIKLADKQSELSSENPAQIIIHNEWKRREKVAHHNLNRKLIEIQNKTNKKLLARQYELNKNLSQSQSRANSQNKTIIFASLIGIIGVVTGVILMNMLNKPQIPHTQQIIAETPADENSLQAPNEKNIESNTPPVAIKDVELENGPHREEHLSQAVNVYLKAEATGLDHRYLYKNLALALNELLLLDETVTELKKALHLASDDVLLHVKLGILYLVKNEFDLAEKELTAALSNDPAYADAYYYLGEVFVQTGQYTLAWYANEASRKLGHHGHMLSEKLKIEGTDTEPLLYPWEKETTLLSYRQIILSTQIDAELFLERYLQDDLSSDVVIGKWGKQEFPSGFAGNFTPAELQGQIADALLQQKPFAEPVIVEIKNTYHVVQRVLPFDLPGWKKFAHEKNSVQPINEHVIVQEELDASPLCVKNQHVDLQKRRIYVGAYVKINDAVSAVNRLIEEDFPAFCLETTGKDQRIIYNAVAGQFATFTEAETVLEQLKEKGYTQAFISRRRQ